MPDTRPADNPPTAGERNAAGPGRAAGTLRRNRHARRVASRVVIGLAAIAIVQVFAARTDYQIAFLTSAGIAAAIVLYVLINLQIATRRAGRPWRVPVITLVALFAFFTLFRFTSFSGEMVPQFEFRFGQRPAPELVTKVTNDRSRAAAEPSASNAPAAEPWLGFLGPNRSGVIANREFELPPSAAEVSKAWDIGIGQGWASFAVAGEIAVTLEQRDDQECVTAYRLDDGALLWLAEHTAAHFDARGGGGPRTTPSIHDGRVYAQGATGFVWCLDLLSGEVLWTVDLLELAGWKQSQSELELPWGRAGSPLLVDGLCVLPFGAPKPVVPGNANASNVATGEIADDNSDLDESTANPGGRSLVALDAATGEVRWTAGQAQISYASPQLLTLAGQRQIVIVNEDTITGHVVADGEELWSMPWPGSSNFDANCASVVPAGSDRFLVGKGYGGGSSLVEVRQDQEGTLRPIELWNSNRILKTKFNHACVVPPLAFGISNGALEAVQLDDAEPLWKQSRGERCGQGQAILAEDLLIVQNESGDLSFVEASPHSYQERLRIPALSAKTWNIPTLAGRYLLVRNDQQAICFELPKRKANAEDASAASQH